VNLNRESGSPFVSLSFSCSLDRPLARFPAGRIERSKVYLYIRVPSVRAFGIHPGAVSRQLETHPAAPAALENSPVVSQIDIVRRAKVRRRESSVSARDIGRSRTDGGRGTKGSRRSRAIVWAFDVVRRGSPRNIALSAETAPRRGQVLRHAERAGRGQRGLEKNAARGIGLRCGCY